MAERNEEECRAHAPASVKKNKYACVSAATKEAQNAQPLSVHLLLGGLGWCVVSTHSYKATKTRGNIYVIVRYIIYI
jgi:hypothetical protein